MLFRSPGRRTAGNGCRSSQAGTEPPGAGDEAVVLVSGCLGLVYLTASKERLTLEEIAAEHPRLVETLASHPGISFVMVRSREHGPLVIGRGGRRRLDGDLVEGEDPLAGFDATAAGRSEERRVGKECSELCRSRWSPYH